MSIVVSDTSPILNLARVGRLDLLPALYGNVIIPPGVVQELTDSRADAPLDVTKHDWISVVAPHDRTRVAQFAANLDAGESEAFALAIEINADLILVDERRARKTAIELGFEITGLLGVLRDAKAAGLIVSMKPLLDDLMRNAKFRVDAELYRLILSEAGEI